MKRSRFIDLERMRASTKCPSRSELIKQDQAKRSTIVRPVTVAISVAVLVGCGEPEKTENVKVVSSVEDCVAQSDMSQGECEAAYQKAVANAARTGPRYQSRYACEEEYGYSRCQSHSGGIFMPMMAGFMIGRMTGGSSYNPIYQNSRLNGRLMTANGTVLGRPGQGSYQVGSSHLKPQMKATRTSSRGGFGSTASARSSWGRSRSSRSWGG